MHDMSGIHGVIVTVLGEGYQLAEVFATDGGFSSDGCGEWTSDLSALQLPREEFGPGTYLVGTDVAPGRWRAVGGASCYWARLQGLSGEDRDIIESALVSGEATTELMAGDVAFTSDGCGSWRWVGKPSS